MQWDDGCWVVGSDQVAQLSGFVSADTAYHHGEASLQSTIIGLAHNFIGSNNVNLLVPQGEHACLFFPAHTAVQTFRIPFDQNDRQRSLALHACIDDNLSHHR